MESENLVIVNLRIHQLCLSPQEKDPQRQESITQAPLVCVNTKDHENSGK